MRFIEVEVVVFGKQDGFRGVAGECSRLVDHFGDAIGVGNAVSVEHHEIRDAGDVVVGDAVAAIGCSDGDWVRTYAGMTWVLDGLGTFDEFCYAVGLKNFVFVAGDVCFIVDFDEDVAVTHVEEPVCGLVDGIADCSFIVEAFVLSEVEVAEDDDHS